MDKWASSYILCCKACGGTFSSTGIYDFFFKTNDFSYTVHCSIDGNHTNNILLEDCSLEWAFAQPHGAFYSVHWCTQWAATCTTLVKCLQAHTSPDDWSNMHGISIQADHCHTWLACSSAYLSCKHNYVTASSETSQFDWKPVCRHEIG